MECDALEHLPAETTTYSLAHATPANRERRDDKRHLTLFRVGAITVEGRRELCLIKNISAGGMKIRPYCKLEPGDRLTVELKTGTTASGRVAWVDSGNAGVEFDEAVDVLDILATSQDGPRPRMPRIEVNCFATVREGARNYRMRVVDVSQGGLKLESAVVLPQGSDIVVTLPAFMPQPGVTRWCDDGFVGVTFNRLLSLSELVDWLRILRDEAQAA